LPFGLAQVANGELVKGAIIGGIQGAFLVGNVAGYWANIALSKAGPDDTRTFKTQNDAITYRVLQTGHALMLVGFGLTWGYSVADALWNRDAQVVVSTKEQRRPLKPSDVRPVPPTTDVE
jgi:hypothetical protein